MRHVFTHGWNRQKRDGRDFKLALPSEVYVETQILTKGMPPVWDQGQLGSCTAHGSLAAFEFCLFNLAVPVDPLSRLQVYYDTRVLGGSYPAEDSGGVIRDAVRVLASIGAAPEAMWPYDVGQFAIKPPQGVYDAAQRMEALEYRAVPETVAGLKGALALGLPVIIGFDVYGNFQDIGADGIMPMPDGQVEGGHCVCVVGFSDREYHDSTFGLLPAGYFLVRNSWGADWGRHGHFLMPYAAVEATAASDFWVIAAIQKGE